MKMRSVFAMLVAAMLAVTGPACDDDDGDFEIIDEDNDSFIEVQEWANLFPVWDVNDDGVLVGDEFLLDDGFDLADLNDDGLLSVAEWEAAFGTFDIDDDSLLDADELFF